MSTSPTMPPAPGGTPQGQDVSTAPATINPMMQRATSQVIGLVQGIRELAKQYPEVAPEASQINDLLRQVIMKVNKNQTPGEPAAPPA